MSPREFAARPGRASLEMDVGVRSASDSFTAVSKNIGLGGMFVATERRLAVGDHCTVDLKLPDQPRPISVAAEVRWVREGGQPAGAGLMFVNLPIGALIALHDLLRKLDPPPTVS